MAVHHWIYEPDETATESLEISLPPEMFRCPLLIVYDSSFALLLH